MFLEQEVNDWLETKKIEIVSVVQTESDQNGYITLTILYLDQNEIRSKKLEILNNI
jgi:hypothetical protein